jgi:hypothetical protein
LRAVGGSGGDCVFDDDYVFDNDYDFDFDFDFDFGGDFSLTMGMKKEPENDPLGYSDTPVLPDSGYHVHDGTRPQPPVVAAPAGRPPADATVLFDGSGLGHWVNVKDGGPCGWRLVDGAMEVVPGTGDIRSVEAFADCQLHLEFRSPEVVRNKGQGRGNSGVFLMERYEVQVLDNWDNPTYADGTVGALYGQTPPLANAIRRPGEWNEYDIVWKAPVFAGGKPVSPAVITVLLNGVVLHHAKELQGPTEHKKLAGYREHPASAPLKLQDHGDLVRFRNIWVREVGQYDAG